MQIRRTAAPVRENGKVARAAGRRYQDEHMEHRALFICSRNRLRSPTAEAVFATWPGVQTDSAGLASDAEVVLCAEQIDWASVIFVMEQAHRTKLARQYATALRNKRVVCLNIPDNYFYMQPELVRRLESSAGAFLKFTTTGARTAASATSARRGKSI